MTKPQGGEHFKADKDFATEMRRTVSAARSDDENPLSQKIAAATSAIDEQVRPHLRRS